MVLFKSITHTTMDTEKRKILQRRIQTAASLTPHQAGKVAGAVLHVLGIDNINKYSDIFAEDTDSKEIIRQIQSKPGGFKRTNKDCAKDCHGLYCESCPDFTALVDVPFVLVEEHKEIVETFDRIDANENIGKMHIDIKPGSIILDPKEFELIKHTLKGAIKSTINEKVNVLRKYGDNPEQFEEAIEDIRVISKLISRLDKI